jgi:hypothetical protein
VNEKNEGMEQEKAVKTTLPTVAAIHHGVKQRVL